MFHRIHIHLRRVLEITALALIGLTVQTASAIISVKPPGSATYTTNSGRFDVYISLTNPELTIPPPLIMYSIGVNPVHATSGTITPADVQFSINSSNSGNPVNRTDIFPSSDVYDNSGVTAPITSGGSAASSSVPLFDNAGLMSVDFTVAPGKYGTFDVSLDDNLTRLWDDEFNPIPRELKAGVITIERPPPITVLPESATYTTNSGSFDVYLRLPDPESTTPPSLSSYSIGVNPVSATTGTITAADVQLSFNSSNSGNPENKTDIFPAIDVTDTSSGTAPKTSGKSSATSFVPLFDNAGLMSVDFTVSPGKYGSFDVSLDPILTSLHDDNLYPMPKALRTGVITIEPPPPITVPSSIPTGAFLLVGLGLIHWLKRRIDYT